MSDQDQQHHQGPADSLLLAEKVKPKKPAMYAVIMLNDDFTPMEFVVYVLQKVFRHNMEEATRLMLQVHHEGQSVVGIYSYDIAQTKIEKVHALAREEEHPLQCTLEPED
ncbi:MAG: ATP-dependent Clp protease adapter ClpS [Leptospiraceae bacterium]|nr:ATP-dependent Clp protease adapter ClpS [Leptospiraceae bacterium]